MESTYLYHPENRDNFYQSLLQEEHCLHARNLNALIDASKDDPRFKFLRGHVSKCQKCKKHYDKLLAGRQTLGELVPHMTASEETTAELNLEIAEFVSVLEQSILREKKNLKRKKINGIKEACSDVYASIFSFSTVKGLVYATVGFVILKAVL